MGARAEIFTEGGAGRGYGHVTRCTALAQGLLDEGISVRLWVDGGDIPTALKLQSVEWVSAEWHAGGDEIVGRLGHGFLLLVDSYLAPLSTYLSLSARAGRSLYVDDFGRLPYPSGIILNSAQSTEGLYPTWPAQSLLLGPAFQPLREPFWLNPAKEAHNPVQAMLVTLGGGAPPQAISELASAAARKFPTAMVYAVGLPAAPPKLNIIPTGPLGAAEMARLMEGCDIAVSAGGQTLLELAAKGVPVVAVETAENQKSNIAGLVAAGAALSAGSVIEPGVAGRVGLLLGRLADPRVRRRMAEKGQRLIDGKGAQRVVQALAYGHHA